MITYKDWFTFLVLVSCWISPQVWGFSFSLNKRSIQIGEVAVLSLVLPNTNRSDRPVIVDDLLDRHPQLKVLERNMSQTDNGMTITFEITAYQASDFRIPPVQVKWGPDTFSTEALELTVTSSRTPDDMEIRSDFGKLRPPFPWRKAYLVFLSGIGALLALWLLRWSFLRIQWRKLSRFLYWRPKLPSFETDRMWLRKEVAKFRVKLKSGQADPELVDQILYTLKLFLQKQTDTITPALTRIELENQLSERHLKPKTKTLLAQVDDFKYHKADKAGAPQVAEELLARIESEFL
jgi:BatD DUF11 like domain